MITMIDFGSQLSNAFERLKTRLIYVLRDDVQTLRDYYGQFSPEIDEIHVSDHVTANGFFPAPTRLFSDLKDRFANCAEAGKIPFVVGLDGYLSLLSKDGVHETFECLKRELDKSGVGMNTVVFVLNREWSEARQVFANPRYEQGGGIVRIDRNAFPLGEPAVDVRLVHDGWVDDEEICAISMQEYLYRREIGQSAENALIKVSFNGVNAFPQINNGISQLFTLKLWCQSLLGADVAADELSDGAYEWLHENIQVLKGMTSIEHHFYPNGIADAEADGLLRLVQTESDAEFEVLCWLLKNKLAENSYLKWVLADKTIARNVILDAYVCKVRENRHSLFADGWRMERREAIDKFPPEYVRASIVHFIDLMKDVPCEEALSWFNFGAEEEKCECVRRVMKSEGDGDKTIRLVREKYPDFDRYLSDSVSGNDEMDAYFAEYRRLKCLNVIDDVFCAKAYECSGSHSQIASRDLELQQWSGDAQTKIVVVDALGGEYLSMLIELAKANHAGIREAKFVRVCLPTSTKFNDVDHAAQKINGLDAICHNGVKLHEANADEENFVGELNYITKTVMPVIQSSLSNHQRVVLTADHGTSRLAVLAHLAKKNKTLDAIAGTTPVSWRIAEINNVSTNVDSGDVVANLENTHVSVKGYNRFSFSGGCGFEIHGGATVEECVVPFIVFEKGATYVPPVKIVSDESTAQIVEDSDFDI